MGTLINFLIDNFIYVIFIAILLILALIGYIVDSKKSAKLREELTKTEQSETVPLALSALDSNVTLGETVNKMAMNGVDNVNKEQRNDPLDMS